MPTWFFNTLFFNRPYYFCSPEINMPPLNRNTPYNNVRAMQEQSWIQRGLGPYGWTSNIGGNIQFNTYDPDMPLENVIQLQRMNQDPNYNPGLDIYYRMSEMFENSTYNNDMAQIAANAENSANRTILKIEYRSLQRNIPALISSIDKLLETEGLKPEDKKGLEKIKKQTEDLKKKMETMAETSSNKKVTDAIEEVEAMEGELLKLKEAAVKIAEKIAAYIKEEEDTNPNEDVDPVTPGEDVNPVTPGNDENPVNPIEEEEDLTVEELKIKYNEELKKEANKLLKEKDLHPEDKQTITEKIQALETAISENKPVEELTEMYNELIELLNTVQQKLTVKNNFDELTKTYEKMLKENKDDISEEDKQAITKQSKELEAAIKANKPLEEQVELYNKLYELVCNVAQKVVDKPAKDALEICSEIYKAANGIDWSNSNEYKIKEAVAKINEKNVIEVLDQWSQNNYNKSTGDTCILETIFGEFKTDSKTKRLLAYTFINALKKAAEKLGKSNEIAKHIAVIEGEIDRTGLLQTWDYSAIYSSFNKIHAILGNPLLEGEQQQ